MRVKAYAKVNLFLEILGKREDGYHELYSVMRQIGLFDEIEIKKAEGFHYESSDANLPLNEHNLIIKAVNLFREEIKIDGLYIRLKKNIPMGAGLGGGSSDAAMTLFALNELYNKPLKEVKLYEMAASLGADVPFFLKEEAAIVQGIGTEITSVKNIELPNIFLIKPKTSLSTQEVYRNLKEKDYEKKLSREAFLSAYLKGDLKGIEESMGNHLEASSMRLCPEIKYLKESLKKEGIEAMMSGSGSTLFGFVESMRVEALLGYYREKGYWVMHVPLR